MVPEATLRENPPEIVMPEQPIRHAVRVVISAGEASGDLHGAHLIRELRQLVPDLDVQGIGGKNLEAHGVRLVAHISDMAMVGITEVLFKLRLIRRVFARMRRIFREDKPDLLILIDYSGFNLPLARAAKKEGIPVLYYVSPQVWASRRGRIEKIRKTVDRLAVIIPFEAALYQREGILATFVGHPLLDIVQRTRSRQEALADFTLTEGRPIVGILPGSRKGEIRRLLPVMLEAAALLKDTLPQVQFVLPLADTLSPQDIAETLKHFPLEIRVIQGATYDAVGVSDAVMVASGTATLETAMLETPMIIVYKVSELTYQIGKRFVYVDQIGLVNIVAGKPIVPEFIQGAATPRAMAGEIKSLLTDKTKRETMVSELHRIRTLLGEPGAARRAAEIAADMLRKAGNRLEPR